MVCNEKMAIESGRFEARQMNKWEYEAEQYRDL